MRRAAPVALVALLSAAWARADESAVDVAVIAPARPPTEDPRDSAAAAYVVEGGALERPGGSAADALADVPGVEVTRSGSGADLATASLRGATGPQTPVYLAGIRLNDDLTGTADLANVPIWLLRRIDVYRGDAPLDADRLGMGGAIFFEPELPSRTAARVLLGAGSFGQRNVAAALASGSESSAALLAVRYDTARNDYALLDDNGTRFDPSDDAERLRANADHRQVDTWAIGRWRGRFGQVTALVHGLARDAGAPGLQIVPAKSARASSHRALAGLSGLMPCDALGCSLSWQVDGLVTRYRLGDPLGEIGNVTRAHLAGERTRQRLTARFSPLAWLSLAAGASQEIARVDVLEGSTRIAAHRHLARGDFEARARIAERAEIGLTGAVECYSEREACEELVPAARIAARVRLIGPLTAIANAGRYVRVPALGELYGLSDTVRGNPSLRPERSLGADVGLMAAAAGDVVSGYGQVVGFARASEDLIGYQRSSFGAVRPYNVGAARVLGVEIAGGVEAWRRLAASVAMTLLDPRDISEGRQVESDLLPLRSRLTVAPQLEVRSPPWRLVGLRRATLGARWLYRSSRVADPAGLVVLDAQGQLDLETSAAFGTGEITTTVRARVANVLDQRASDLIGYPLPGRAGYATAEVSF